MQDAEKTMTDWLEGLGADQVALLIKTEGIAPAQKPFAIKWLAEARRKEARYQENLETMRMQTQLDVAKSAEKAAWIGAWAALAAAVLSAIGIAVTILHH